MEQILPVCGGCGVKKSLFHTWIVKSHSFPGLFYLTGVCEECDELGVGEEK